MVSDKGRVKALPRTHFVGIHRAKLSTPEKILRPRIRRNGYCIVSLWRDGRSGDYYVHRLVATAFIENPLGYNVVNHKDQNPRNNVVDNLEWCTQRYNSTYNDSHLVGAEKRCKPIVQKTIDGSIIRTWRSAYDAGLSFRNKYAAHNINNALKNHKRKTAYGYVWEYA